MKTELTKLEAFVWNHPHATSEELRRATNLPKHVTDRAWDRAAKKNLIKKAFKIKNFGPPKEINMNTKRTKYVLFDPETNKVLGPNLSQIDLEFGERALIFPEKKMAENFLHALNNTLVKPPKYRIITIKIEINVPPKGL